jgi:hypothetical protein
MHFPIVSDADGGFTIVGLKAGTYVLSATEQTNGYELRPHVSVPAGRTDLTLVLERLPSVRGCVKDPDGTPIPESTVTVTQSAEGTASSRAESVRARDGCFSQHLWARPSPASIALKVEVDGVQVEKGPFPSDGKSDLVVGEIIVGRGRRVVLTVRDGRDSTPVKGAEVGVQGQPGAATGTLASATTDSDGMAQLTLGSDVSTQIEVWHSGYAASRLTIAPHQSVATVVLGPGGTLRGSVSIAGGGRLLSTTVFVEDGLRYLSADVSEDGSYAITGVTEGRHTVSVYGNEAAVYDGLKEHFPEMANSHLRALEPVQRRVVAVNGSGVTTCDFQLPADSPLVDTSPPEGPAEESGQEWPPTPEPDEE